MGYSTENHTLWAIKCSKHCSVSCFLKSWCSKSAPLDHAVPLKILRQTEHKKGIMPKVTSIFKKKKLKWYLKNAKNEYIGKFFSSYPTVPPLQSMLHLSEASKSIMAAILATGAWGNLFSWIKASLYYMVIPLVFGLWSAILSPQNKLEVNKMPQWTRVIAVQASWSGEESWDPDGGNHEPTPINCPLAYTCLQWHMSTAHVHILNSKSI